MSDRKKILWLVSWYPNKYDPFDGDFIQRHAKAAALYDDIHVFFIKQAEEQNEFEEFWYENNGLTEQIFYLPKEVGLVGKWKNYRRWKRIYKTQLRLLIKHDRPHLVHVHVPWKAGMMALWIKRTFGIPFLVTEHWGIYNNIVEDNIHTKSFLFRSLLKKIYKEASRFISVSRFLGEGVNKTVIKKDFTVIPNVVDTSLFYPVPEKHSRFTFLHVSNMVPLKNVDGILAAFQNFLLQTDADAQLILIGNRDEHYPKVAQQMGLLNKTVFFKGEIPYSEVAKEMQHAHVFVLNSNIENSPCVIGEALCCGLPVIATDVGGVPELVSTENSILILTRNEKQLVEAMVKMFKNCSQFTVSQIADQGQQTFSFQTIGARHHRLYIGG
jgi:glycosyltransferase involved in cell wall biosynthesis